MAIPVVNLSPGALGDGRGRIAPAGRRVDLPGRGSIYVRDVEGPRNAPTVVLLHGWCATGGLNWFRVFDPLAAHFNVVAPDLRGHGRGVRAPGVFRLHDAADDIAELLIALGTGPAIAVGYSMGGPVAQLLWKRHRDLVSGLVLCATAARFMPGGRERVMFTTAMAAAAGGTRLGGIAARIPGPHRVWPALARSLRTGTLPEWAAAEFRRHDLRLVLEAGHSIGTYDARRWIGEIDVPAAAVVTTGDRTVAPQRQTEMAHAIPGATIHPVDDGHLACANPSFATPLLEACLQVARRGATAHAAATRRPDRTGTLGSNT